MFCTKCGKKIDDNAKFCIYCGAQIIENKNIGTDYIIKTDENSPVKKRFNKSMIVTGVGIIAAFVVFKLCVPFILSLFRPKYEIANEYGNLSIISNKGKYGVMNASKKIIVPIEYNDIMVVDSYPDDGYMIYMDEERSFTDKEGKLLYDELTRDDDMECYIAKKDGRYGVISMDGAITIPIQYKKITTEATDGEYIKAEVDGTVYFLQNTGDVAYQVTGTYKENGLAAAKDNYDYYGLIDENGEEIIEFNYIELGEFNKNGLALVKNDDNKYGYINEDGSQVIPPEWDELGEFADNGYAYARRGHYVNFLALNGQKQYESVEQFNENDVAIAVRNRRYIFIDKKGDQVSEKDYDMAGEYDWYGNSRVRLGNKYGLVNSSGQELIEVDYDFLYEYILYDYEELGEEAPAYIVWKDGKTSVIWEDDSTPKFWFEGSVESLNANAKRIVLKSKEGKRYIADMEGNFISELSFEAEDEDTATYYIYDDCIRIGDHDKYGLMDLDMNEILSLENDNIEVDYRNGEAIVSKDGKTGIYNYRKKEWVVESIYESIQKKDSYGENLACLNGEYGFIKDDKTWQSIHYGTMGDIKVIDIEGTDDYWIVDENDRMGTINRTGSYIISPKYDYISVQGGYLEVSLSDEKGLLDLKGNEIVPTDYYSIHVYLDYGLIRADDGEGVTRYYDLEGNRVIDSGGWQSGISSEGLITVNEGYSWWYYDTNGNEFMELPYENVGVLLNSMASVKDSDGREGFINALGMEIVYPQYRMTNSYGEDGLAAVYDGNQYGFIDETGTMVVPCQYDDTLGFSCGYAAVKKDDLWGYIDALGNEIIAPQYSYARYVGSTGCAYVMTTDDGPEESINVAAFHESA